MQLQGAKKVIFTYSLPFQQAVANNQLQKNLRHCTVFWHKWPVHYQFEWEGGVRSVLSHRPVTSNDLMKERFFFNFAGVSQHFCNWLSESFIPI